MEGFGGSKGVKNEKVLVQIFFSSGKCITRFQYGLRGRTFRTNVGFGIRVPRGSKF